MAILIVIIADLIFFYKLPGSSDNVQFFQFVESPSHRKFQKF